MQEAIDKGYTRRVYATGGTMETELLVKPETDLDDTFKAYAVDWSEWTMVYGCNCLFEELDNA